MTCPADFNTYIDVINCVAQVGFSNDLILASAVLLLLIMLFMFKTRFTLEAAVAAGIGITFAYTTAYGGIWVGFFYGLLVILAVFMVRGWLKNAER